MARVLFITVITLVALAPLGAMLTNATSQVVNGVLFTPMGMNVNGQAKPIGSLIVNEPLNVVINYEASANVNTVSWGLPALYATATLKCGSAMTTTSGSFVSSLSLSITNPPTNQCTITETTIPLTPLIIVVIVIIIIVVLIITRRGRRTASSLS
jgi:hypothetical protein